MSDQSQETKIKQWYSQALHEEFNPFIKLWIAFNGWYKLKFPNTRTDREAINKCKQDDELLRYYQRSFSNERFCRYMEILGKELEREPLKNTTRPRERGLKLDNMEDEEGNISFLDNTKEAMGSYLEVLYRARCNLFHCGKSPTSDRDKLIIECCFNTLSVIMKNIVDNLEE